MKKIIKDSFGWNKMVSALPKEVQDIYFTYEHFDISNSIEQGEPEAFYYEEGGNKFFYPYFINPIEGYDLDSVYYDIQTPYGYGGPVANSTSRSFLEKAEASFLDYCSERNIVCEFVRFHPLIENHELFNSSIEVIPNRKTVVIDLTKDLEDIWMNSITSKNRNVIRKAEKNGLRVIKLEDIDAFKITYKETMSRIGADAFYFFNDEYFKLLSQDERYNFLGVEYNGKIIACGIFISSGVYFHYHLAGSLSEYLSLSPNNLMLYEAIKLGKELGNIKMFLGGGLQNSTEDSLFKFKASFSKDVCDFYVGKRIHNRSIYNYLIEEWEKRNGRKSSILLQYRY